MPKGITLIRILVSSPSDLAKEREMVRQISEELNRSLLSDQQIRLEVISWVAMPESLLH